MKDENQNEKYGDKSLFYSKEKIKVHIGLNNGKFLNGLIKEIGADFLIMEDRIMKRTIVFFIEIREMEPFTEARRE